MKTVRIITCLLGLLCVANYSHGQAASVIINEFQTLNNTTLADEDTTYSDWVELCNRSASSVDLKGWSLTDSKTMPGKWFFPSVKLEPGAFLIVFCSGNDRNDPTGPLHSNFKLAGDESYLGLFDAEGRVVTEFNPYPALPPDYSLGWLNGDWVTYATPTPGKANGAEGYAQYPKPIFSKNRGLYSGAFNLTLTCALTDARIFYTLDGSPPSPANGQRYLQPIPISKTSIVRAMSAGAATDTFGSLNSRVATSTYLFTEDILKQGNTPIGYPAKWGKYDSMSDTAIADYEMDPEITSVQTNADKIRQSFRNLPIVSLVTDKNNLFSRENNATTGGIYMYTGTTIGDGWERPASFEYFTADNAVSIQADCGIELHGSASRMPEKSPKHSMKVAFKSKYGAPKLYYPLFGEDQAQKLNAFYLRSGFGFSWVHWDNNNRLKGIYSRDEWAKVTQRKMGNLSGNTQHAHLFINGMYWGLYNPTEKMDDDFCETYLGGDKMDWDVVRVEELNTVWKNLCAQAKTGSDTVFHKIQGNNLDGTPNPEYPPLLDMENFIDYMVLNLYGGNDDWDHHNWYAARNRVNPGKGFQFFCWDSESLLLSTTSNLVAEYNANCPSDLFQSLRKNPLFCRQFGDRVQKHCYNGGALTPEVAAKTFTDLVSPIEDALYAESARWGDYRRDVHPYTSAGALYKKDVQYDAQKKWMLETYFPQRTANFVSYMKTAGLFPSVTAPNLWVNGASATNDTLQTGDKITMTAAAGKIYYTTDETDPVRWNNNGGAATTPSTKQYIYALTPTGNTRIKARAVYNGVWSALLDMSFLMPSAVDVAADRVRPLEIRASMNPFRNTTVLRFALAEPGRVELNLYDLSGRCVTRIRNGWMEAGEQEILLYGAELQAGVYLCKLERSGTIRSVSVLKLVRL
jgi:hypothetical protein